MGYIEWQTQICSLIVSLWCKQVHDAIKFNIELSNSKAGKILSRFSRWQCRYVFVNDNSNSNSNSNNYNKLHTRQSVYNFLCNSKWNSETYGLIKGSSNCWNYAYNDCQINRHFYRPYLWLVHPVEIVLW